MTSQLDPGSPAFAGAGLAGITKMMTFQFPHFSQLKNARLVFSLEIVLLWASLAALIAINVLALQKGRPAHWNKLMMLLETPFSSGRHIELASLLWKQGQKEDARRLVTSAQTLANLSQPDQSDQLSNILGATTNPQAILAQWEYEDQELKEKYVFWQSIAAARPDYRDVFVTLAALAYQLGKLNEARNWLTKAYALDPTSPIIQALEKLLE